MKLNKLTITQARAGLDKKEFSAVGLTKACLNAIKKENKKLNAVLTVCGLEALAEAIGDQFKMGVIEGDIATAADSERLAKKGVPTVQINTGGGCHLEAGMVNQALHDMPLDQLDLLIIENVGNLVCPADFNLGEHDKAMILSVSEGDDKPKKYPGMFRKSTTLIINKIDLLGTGNFSLDKAIGDALSIQPQLKIFPLSAWKKEGLTPLIDWLKEKTAQAKG